VTESESHSYIRLMTGGRLGLAEELSALLAKSLPIESQLVQHYREQHVWDQAILESLAAYVEAARELPADVRSVLDDYLSRDGVGRPLKKRASFLLKQIPA
jgi:hypothetical protein